MLEKIYEMVQNAMIFIAGLIFLSLPIEPTDWFDVFIAIFGLFLVGYGGIKFNLLKKDLKDIG